MCLWQSRPIVLEVLVSSSSSSSSGSQRTIGLKLPADTLGPSPEALARKYMRITLLHVHIM